MVQLANSEYFFVVKSYELKYTRIPVGGINLVHT